MIGKFAEDCPWRKVYSGLGEVLDEAAARGRAPDLRRVLAQGGDWYSEGSVGGGGGGGGGGEAARRVRTAERIVAALARNT